jgi:hypothetical protein
MKRHLCAAALFAVVLVPDWTAACGPRWGMASYERPYYAPAYHPPAYHGPVYYAVPVCPPPVYVQPCVPVMPPPRVEVKPRPTSALPEAPRAIARPEAAPAKPPVVEPVRPAAGADVPKPQPPVAKPEPAPAPDEPKRGGLFDIPKLIPPKVEDPNRGFSQRSRVDNPPKVELPKLDGPKPQPAPDLPKVDAPRPPSIELPKDVGAPKLPPLELPGAPAPAAPGPAPAVPSPAPAPESLIPPPGLPAPRGPDSLPPLALPPDVPITPVPKSTEVKSSPLAAGARELKVNVFPAAGAAPAAGLRTVGFYNHTGRDLALTIEGKAVTLPAMSYLHAQLPPTFTWKCADQPTAKATVPADAAGVDVLIRE